MFGLTAPYDLELLTA